MQISAMWYSLPIALCVAKFKAIQNTAMQYSIKFFTSLPPIAGAQPTANRPPAPASLDSQPTVSTDVENQLAIIRAFHGNDPSPAALGQTSATSDDPTEQPGVKITNTKFPVV